MLVELAECDCCHFLPRSPDAAQRAVLHGVVRCKAGAVTSAGVWYGPGSAERHEECRTASGTRCLMHLPFRYWRFELGDLRGFRRLAVEGEYVALLRDGDAIAVPDVAGEDHFRQRV